MLELQCTRERLLQDEALAAVGRLSGGLLVPKDPARVLQVLLKLVTNAVDATSAGDHVLLKAKQESKHRVRIEVENHGPAIAEWEWTRILRPN